MKPDQYYSINDQIVDQLDDLKYAKHNIKILRAFRDGKALEERHHQMPTWHDLHSGVYRLNFDAYRYRIKKLPK